MRFNIRRNAFLVMLVAFVLGASACNTVEGIGKDTERAGEKIQKSSE